MKSGFCCLYGRANAGKSTILNAILKTKIEAVSEKPQTTRENIRGIYNDDESQIIFVDTPGLHKPHKRLGQLMLRQANEALKEVDVVVYVVDASRAPDSRTLAVMQALKSPLVIAFNKIDLVRLDEGQARLAQYRKAVPTAKVVEISALKKAGIDDLLSAVKSLLPEGEAYYPTDMMLDHPIEFVYGEIIREKVMRLTDDEVPHATHVEIRDVETEEDGVLVIRADIIVERESEKAILIGRQGRMISKIRSYAEEALKGFTGTPVALDLLVKVVPDWRDSQRSLARYGYER